MDRRQLLRGGIAAPFVPLLAGCAAPPGRPAPPTSPVPPNGAIPALAPQDVAWIDRVAWGIDPAAARAYGRLGRAAWLQAQLHPSGPAALPAPAQAQVDAMSIVARPLVERVQALDRQRREADAIAGDDERKKAAQQAYQQEMSRQAREASSRFLLRALYSPHSLQEQMTAFWLNHFSVHQYKANLRPMVGDYEDALRPHALGRFADLLVASATHPAMVLYLDNAQNAARRINENYAREVMELHTLGVDGGYAQADVQELARVLTGMGVNAGDPPRLAPALQPLYLRRGLTEFNPARHDMGDKALLGQRLAGGRGWDEILEQLGRLARHPATARHVCRRIAMHMAADDPPPALVDRMARAFLASDGRIAAVLQAMFDAPEFAPTLGRKFKDPQHYVVSAVRQAYGDRVVLNTAPMLGWLGRLGQQPFNRQTPDGYPLDAGAWSGPGQMATRFEIARALGGGPAGLFKPEGAEGPGQPAFPQLAGPLHWNAVAGTLGPATRAALDQATSPQEWNALLLSSPEAMNR
ncbi:MAG: DUF1800 domain-containing protein [Xylophilus ampelinus]